jgi:hypothetical protein
LDIESIGTTRELSEYGDTTILTPEAYKVSITLKQLVATSSNIFAGALGEGSVNVIGSFMGNMDRNVESGTNAVRNAMIAAGATPATPTQ